MKKEEITELTRRQKIKVLKYAINKIRCKQHTFMCTAIEDGYSTLNGCEYECCHYATDRIPELLNYKPSNISLTEGAWFLENDEGRTKRINILNEIIKKLEDNERTEQEEKDKGIEVGDKIY